jgi:hypothetical protein
MRKMVDAWLCNKLLVLQARIIVGLSYDQNVSLRRVFFASQYHFRVQTREL